MGDSCGTGLESKRDPLCVLTSETQERKRVGEGKEKNKNKKSEWKYTKIPIG